MINNVVISLSNVSKKFQKGHKFLLKEAVLNIFRPQKQEDFWALKDVSFDIKKGETVGIIGANGSGKSTILKLIAGVINPTQGEVMIDGRVSPLIELGAGFHPELSGRENIYLNGTILGLSKKEVDKKFDDIVSFSGLGDFIDTPIKHYSSGMYMRLGFSIAIHVDPGILLIDEILSVGDMAFQKKCLDKIEKFHQNGLTIVIVSHSLDLIKNFCQKIILLDKGAIVESGSYKGIIKEYRKLMV